MARKPLSEKTIVDNVLKWGTGGINIDGCRVEGRPRTTHKDGSYRLDSTVNAPIKGYGSIKQDIPQGRFPANIILDEVAGELLDEQSGILRQCSTIGQVDNAGTNDLSFKIGGHKKGMKKPKGFKANTYAGASRFFYCAKASKRERGTDNAHPTVKPIKLMEYLVRLVTPDGGIVLDPFMGSGTTGIAAKNEGFGFVGIERELEYLEIASKRIG